MNVLSRLQQWYLDQCDEDWEHQFGVAIDTLDNPGWIVRIDLKGTELEDKPFEPVRYGMVEDSDVEHLDWIDCKIESGKFVAAAGPTKLEEALDVFLTWAAA
jgi:hypothetical protein